MKPAAWVVPLSLLIASPAFGLEQAMHEQITINSCHTHGLPNDFCVQLGSEAYNVDHYEFDDLSAHAQMEEGQTACDGADAVLWRMHYLGREVNAELWNSILSPTRRNNNALARALGRMLHTAQDDCAHSGMTNPEHAWKSLSDECEGTSISPDVQPYAIVCASWATDAILDSVVDTLHDNGAEVSALDPIDASADHWPSYGDACDFLASAQRWNGIDRRWDNNIVAPAVIMAAKNAIADWDDPGRPAPICDSAPDGILVGYEPDVVAGEPPDCPKIDVFCLGKADSPGEQAPDGTPVVEGGCQLGSQRGAGGELWVLVAALGLVALRRRRAG